MATYHYQAKRGPREVATGLIEADSRSEAVEKLSKKGFFPLKMEELTEDGGNRWLFLKPVSTKDLSFFTRQLADMLGSDVPLLRALDLLQEQTPNAAFRRLLQAVMEHVRGGKSFSEALAAYPDLFSGLYVSLVHTGEVGGMLSETMGRLAAFIEQEEEFQARIWAALAYPVFVLGIGGLTILFLMVFVVPRLTAMFADTGQGMPWIARGLSAVSRAMSSAGGLALFFGLAGAAGWTALRVPKQTKTLLARALFNMPVWGNVMKKGMLARFARTLAMLLAGGVPIIRAMEVVSHVLDNPVFRQQLRKVTQEVEQGSGFSESLRRANLFPVFICQMIAVGEEANTLEKSLEKVAAAYERETDRAMTLAASLLEPMMIVGIGAVIGVIVIGMLLPIFQISTFVK